MEPRNSHELDAKTKHDPPVDATIDETLALNAGETSADFDDLLQQARTVHLDPVASEQQCVDLIDRLKDVNEVRRLAKTLEREASASLVPEKLGQFELLESLGGGGMGQVFRARHSRLGKIQAVKVLHAHRLNDVDAVARFQQEMRAIGQLHHPNIVSAQHADEVDGIPYLVMDYVDGLSLSELAKQRRTAAERLSVEAACELVRQAAVGIQYAHEQGVFHRDIKPGNIMLDQFGVVRVLDLGLARMVGQKDEAAPELTTDQQILGTPDYMAPEQLRSSRDVDARTDVYSLGATLFYLLTGQVTYPSGASDSLMNKGVRILSDPVPDVQKIRKDIPSEVADVISRCLAKDPDERFQSARELAEQLSRWASAEALTECLPEGALSGSQSLVPASEASADRASADASTQGFVRTNTALSDRDKQPPSRKWLTVVCASLIPLIVFAGIVYRLQLPDGGELLVECDDPAAEITVTAIKGKQSETLSLSQQRDGTLELTEGTWSISIKGLDADAFELSQNRIVMRSGKVEKLRVTRKPPPTLNPAAVAARSEVKPRPRSATTESWKAAETQWHPGPGYPSVSGLLSQPAELPGIGPWNIRNRLTQAGVSGAGSTFQRRLDTLDPSGRFLIQSHASATYVSEVETGNIVRTLPLPNEVLATYHVSATRDAARIAMLVRGGRVLIWNQRNRIIFDWMSDDSLYETGRTTGETPGLQWMPDGHHLLIWSKKKAQILSEDGHVVYSEKFPENGGPQCYENALDVVPDTAAVSSTSGAVAFGCSDARIRIWKPATGEWIESEPMPYKADHLASFVSLAWSPDGSRLVSGFVNHSDHVIRIWNADGTSGADFDAPSPAGLCWSPNGRYVVTGSGELLNADGPAGSTRKLPLLDASPTLGRVAWKAYWSSENRIDFVSAEQPILLGRGQLRSFTPTGRQLPSAPQCNPLLVADSAWISEDGPTLVKYAVEFSDAGNDYVTRFQTFSADGTIGDRFDLQSGYLGSRGGLSWIAPRGGRTWVLVGRKILIHDAHGKQTGSVQYDAPEQPVVSWLNGWDSTGSQFALLVQGDNHSFVDLIAPDGTRRQRLELGRNADYYSHFFEWSPSGTSLAITARLKDGSGLTTIWRTDDSTKPAVEFPTATYVPPFGLAWSPDSKWLAVFGSSAPENPTGSLTLFHLPSLHVFEPAALNSFSAVPFWQDGTHVQNDNRLIEVSTESDNGVAEIAKLPFEVQPYEGFVVRGLGPGRSVDYRSPNAGQGASGLDVWTSQNRVATIPFLSREFVPAPVRKSQPTHDGLCLLCFNLAPLVGVLDLKQQAMRFVAMAYDDGTAISLSPAGRIIDGPDDVDPYLMYIVQYPGGAEVALTRREFQDRIGLDESQQAINWVLDIGGTIRLSDTEKWLTRRDVPVSEALPASNRVVGVDLSSCAFDEKESLSRLATIPSLTEVRLNNSTVAHVSGLAGCKTVRSLDLSDTGIESIEKLSHLSEIRTLNLSGTRVRSAIGPTLAAFPELEELDLSKTAIDEFVLSDLAHLKRLRKLDLTGLKIPEGAIDRLRASLPNCKITTGTAVPAGDGSKVVDEG